MASSLSSKLPPCRVLVRSKQRVELCTLPSTWSDDDDTGENSGSKTTLLDQCATTLQALAPDGSAIYVHIAGKGVVKCDLQNNTSTTASPSSSVEPFLANTAGVQMLDVSPRGTYLLTWERLHADKCPNNLKVWSAETGQLLAAWPQKSLSRESWPYLQWTFDEAFAFLVASNSQVRVYAASDLLANNNDSPGNNAAELSEPRFIDKVQVQGCATLSLPRHPPAIPSSAPSSSFANYYLTTFSPKTKNQPGCASIYEWSSINKKFNRLAIKSLFQAESCTTHWSPTSTTANMPACLLTLQTAVDATGESYYGSSQLLLWNGHPPETKNEVLQVPLPQEGPVQAVAWLPNPDKRPMSFIAVAGKMPAMASQHHGTTGQTTFLFGNNVHRNTVAPSPHARFLCLAGFGNLAGGMGFWDVNKQKLLPHCPANRAGTLRAEAVTVHSWAPDSRHFLVATTAPRMNVDNGLRLYKYTGELVDESWVPWKNADYQPNSLLEACFVPVLHGVYPDRPQSPVPERTSEETAAAPAIAATTVPAPKPAGRYVPPSARNRAGGSSLAERLRLEKEGQLQGATTVSTKPASAVSVAGKVIPGLTAASSATGKTKSQIKREKMKKKKEQEQQQQAAATEPEPAKQAAAEPAAPVDPEKRARKIKKLLKQIDELKQRSEPLNDDQKAKVASEAQLRAELDQLAL